MFYLLCLYRPRRTLRQPLLESECVYIIARSNDPAGHSFRFTTCRDLSRKSLHPLPRAWSASTARDAHAASAVVRGGWTPFLRRRLYRPRGTPLQPLLSSERSVPPPVSSVPTRETHKQYSQPVNACVPRDRTPFRVNRPRQPRVMLMEALPLCVAPVHPAVSVVCTDPCVPKHYVPILSLLECEGH